MKARFNKETGASATPSRRPGKAFWICAALAALVLAAYWPTFRNGFVNYDDQDYITENTVCQRGLTWGGVAWAFTTGYAGNWHPPCARPT